MERREFFKLAGASAATLAIGGALFGCETELASPAETNSSGDESVVGSPQVSFEETVDVLIVGSGIAGLSAAMPPIEEKRSVLVVDKRDLLGGESYEANGLFYVSGTDIQKNAGIEKTAEDAWKERKSELEEEGSTDDLRFKQSLVMAQAEWIDHAVSVYQASFADPKDYAKGPTTESFLLPKKGIGDMDSIMSPIKEGLAGKGVSFSLGMKAVAFILDGANNPVGMRFFSSKSDSILDVRARKIVLATGGFCSNQYMINQNSPDQTTIGCLTVHSVGDGIALGATLGGQTAEMDQPALLTSDVPQVSAWGLFGPSVNVSPQGVRFAREDQAGKSATECVSQELGFWWTVFDKQLSEGILSRSVAYVSSKSAKRLVGPFDSLDDLASAMKVPADALADALEAYGNAVEAGKDEEFGRQAGLKPLEGPYYAIKQFPVRYKTLGGLKTSDTGQIVNAASLPVANAYCCGSCAAESANGLASNAAFGMIVGKAIVDELAAEDEKAEKESNEAQS
ncbi:FAD-dependent oxidoreductase [Raoultibacter massiliensis]|uniref:FAD-dependent oxidoreductase n=1 Tax=Raoultibacter massiliensis TaxID=1852371 RepID=A0ABV1J9V4_9ACTN|nr:FAD-dependent oxidoreductase [Raoultibacter massiliensis]